MADTQDTFSAWLAQAQIAQARLTAEQVALLQAAFRFRQAQGSDYDSTRLLSHFLLRCDCGIKVAAVAMMLTHCHKCAFHVRSERLAFQIAAWLKAFYAVAALSHANTADTLSAPLPGRLHGGSTRWCTDSIADLTRGAPTNKTPARRPAWHPQKC